VSLNLKTKIDMNAKILMAGLAFLTFTTVGLAQGTEKKAECCKAKTECTEKKAECPNAKEGEKKACCDAAKAEKAPAAKSSSKGKAAVAKPKK
jgi:hypothetical protein